MTDQRRPPPSRDPADSRSGAREPQDTTPREGTPAFDELDASLRTKDSVPPVGATPDHASDYVPPRPLPKVADHKTMEMVPIKIREDADPKRAPTQKAIYVVQREAEQARLQAEQERAAKDAARSQADSQAAFFAPNQPKGRVGIALGALAVLCTSAVVIVAAIVVLSRAPDSTAPAATILGSAPTAEPPVTPAHPKIDPAPTPVPQPTPPAIPEPSQKAAAEPAASASASPRETEAAAAPRVQAAKAPTPGTASAPPKPKPTAEAPRPINE